MKSATRITVSSFGALLGIAGIEHGIGEILQGNIAPDGLIFPSWAGEGPFSILAGEPALTVIPSLLVAGILTVAFSLMFLAWAMLFVESKHGGAVLILLSIAMLLVGAGLCPPVLGVILAAVANRINKPTNRRGMHLPMGWRNFAANLWPWSLGIGLSTWLLVMPGLPALVYFFGLAPSAELVSMLVLCMPTFLVSTIITGFAFDSLKQNNANFSGTVLRQLTSPVAFESKG